MTSHRGICLALFMVSAAAYGQVARVEVGRYGSSPFELKVDSTSNQNRVLTMSLQVIPKQGMSADTIIRVRKYSASGVCKGRVNFARKLSASDVESKFSMKLSDIDPTDVVVLIPDTPSAGEKTMPAKDQSVLAAMRRAGVQITQDCSDVSLATINAGCRTACLHFNQDCQYFCAFSEFNQGIVEGYCTECTQGQVDPSCDNLNCYCLPPGTLCPIPVQ